MDMKEKMLLFLYFCHNVLMNSKSFLSRFPPPHKQLFYSKTNLDAYPDFFTICSYDNMLKHIKEIKNPMLRFFLQQNFCNGSDHKNMYC